MIPGVTSEGPCHFDWQGLVVSNEVLCHFERTLLSFRAKSRNLIFQKKFGVSDFCRIFAIPFHVNVFEILRK